MYHTVRLFTLYDIQGPWQVCIYLGSHKNETKIRIQSIIKNNMSINIKRYSKSKKKKNRKDRFYAVLTYIKKQIFSCNTSDVFEGFFGTPQTN